MVWISSVVHHGECGGARTVRAATSQNVLFFLSAKFLSLLYIWSNIWQFSAFHCNKPKLVCKTVIVHSFGRKYGSASVYTTCPIKRKTNILRFFKPITFKLRSKFAIQLSLKNPPHPTRNMLERSHMDRPNGLLQIDSNLNSYYVFVLILRLHV